MRLASSFPVLMGFMVAAGSISARARISEVTPGETVVISVDGADAKDGTSGIEAALIQARKIRRRQPAVRIAIELPPGEIHLPRPVLITEEDSGDADRPLVIQGSRTGATRLTGAVVLREISESIPTKLTEVIPGSARACVRAFALPNTLEAAAGIDALRTHDATRGRPALEVFDNGGALRPARWPNSQWARVDVDVSQGSAATNLRATSEQLRAWENEADLWVSGYFGEDWAFETVRARASAAGLVLAPLPEFGLKPGSRYFVAHALAELDEAGEWYRAANLGMLLVWPREGGGRISAAVGAAAFVVSHARHIRLEDLTIERFLGDAIRVTGGENVVVARSTLRWMAGRAAVFAGGTGNGIEWSTVSDTGEGGIVLGGGNRTTLEQGRNYVRGCRIERFSRIGRTYRPAIALEGVGNSAAGNYIAAAPHAAILFSGNDHVIEFNEITDVVAETSDAGAIYTGRDWTAQGTVIRHNYVHDLRAAAGFDVKGIYLDDLASGVRVENNLFLRVDQPVFIGGGRDNEITGNLFVDSSPAIHIDGRGETWGRQSVADPKSEIRANYRAVPVQSVKWRQSYPLLADLLGDEPERTKRNSAKGNVFVGSEPYRLTPEVDAGEQALESPSTLALTAREIEVARTAKDAASFTSLSWVEAAKLSIDFAALDRRPEKSGREAAP